MEGSKSAPKSKRRKKNTEMSVNDRISGLPDPILHHISSFLDMKSVLQTTLLSKRWNGLWKSQNVLNFDQDLYEFEDYNILSCCVDRVLLCRDATNIHTLRLSCGIHIRYESLNAWIHAAFCRNVQELYLCLIPDGWFPLGRLYSKSLRVLNLDFCWEEEDCHSAFRDRTIFALPESTWLPNLKTLHLQSVCFANSDFAQEIFCYCPLLETLFIGNCKMTQSDNLTILAHHKLKHLVIDTLHKGFDRNYNMFYHPREKIFKINISAPNLTYFKCKADLSYEYSLEPLASLYQAEIDMDLCYDVGLKLEVVIKGFANYKKKFLNSMINILGGLCNATSLTISAWLLQVISEARGMLPTPFSLLRYLKVKTWLSRDCFLAISYLLENSSTLETFVLEMHKINSSLITQEENWETELQPDCIFCHLKFVEVRNFVGCTIEVEFLKFLLKKAIVLETLTIFTDEEESPNNDRHLEKFRDMFDSFPRASSSITICFF